MNASRLVRNASLTALGIGLGALAWGSGVDRVARSSPALARVVPQPLRSHAWRSETTLALQRRSTSAEALAARAVLADPLDPAVTSLLGSARFASGDQAGAAAAFRVSGTLGWRDQPTQLYWLLAALDGRDYPVAAGRLDALLRQAPGYPQAPELLGRLGETSPGRAALAERLAARSGWLHVYLAAFDGVTTDQLADRALVLEQSALARAKITCTEIGPLAGALYTQNRAVEARRLWRSHCGARDALLVDGGFDAARLNESSPFAWQFQGVGGLDLRLEPSATGSGQALVLASALPRRQIAAIQAVQLVPGRYRLGWQARDAAGAPSPRIAARLTCKRGEGPWLDGAALGDGSRSAIAAVSSQCPLQWLELALDPGSGAVTLDNVSLAPAG